MHTIKLLLAYYLNISVQAANLSDCRIESKKIDSVVRIESKLFCRNWNALPLTSTVDVPGRRALRSAGTNPLVVPPVRLATVGSRAFPVAATHTWNSLPEHVVSASTLQSFENIPTATILPSSTLVDLAVI